VGGRIALNWILEIRNELVWIKSGSEEGRMEGSCEHGNGPSGSTKRYKIFELANVSLSRRAQLHGISET
jgi:hypothetical protein